jgi:hypothetical protein
LQKNLKIGEKIYSVVSDDNYLDAMGDNFEPHMVQLFRALIGPDDVVADMVPIRFYSDTTGKT